MASTVTVQKAEQDLQLEGLTRQLEAWYYLEVLRAYDSPAQEISDSDSSFAFDSSFDSDSSFGFELNFYSHSGSDFETEETERHFEPEAHLNLG